MHGVTLNGHPTHRVPGILSVSIDGVEGESLLYALPGLAVASGSACATTSGEPSYVLRALGRSDRLAQSTLRLSLGRFSTETDVERAIEAIVAAVTRLRAITPGAAGERRRSSLWRGGARAHGQSRRGRRVRAVARGCVRSCRRPRAGREVVLACRVVDGRVEEARFQAFGCPHLVAAASWLTDRLRGAGREDLAHWDWREAADALAIPPAKFGRLLTLQDAVRAMAGNWPGATASTV